MRTTSKKKPKSKSFFQQEKFTAELSSGQLVIGISILILFGLTCFLLGILLGRSEYTRTVEFANVQQPEDFGPSGDSGDLSEEQPVHLENVAPTIHRLPAPQPTESLPAPETEPPPTPADEVSSPKTPIESTSPIEDFATMPEELTPPAISVPQEPAATSSDLDITNAPYSIQVGVFSQRANAESAKKKIESKTSYPVQLIDIPEKKITVVLAGAFQDRDTAEAARTILREKLGYAGSYIKKNNQ